MHKLFFLKYQSTFAGLDSTDPLRLPGLGISRMMATRPGKAHMDPGFLAPSLRLVGCATYEIADSEAKVWHVV
jgi:hypothetical protein